MSEWNVATPDDISKIKAAAAVAGQQRAELQMQAMLLGYDVTETPGVRLGAETSITFQVSRVDKLQPGPDDPTFPSAEAVRAYLNDLETLPLYCLDLVDNPQIDVVSERDTSVTEVTDLSSGEKFFLRSRDLEAIQTLCIRTAEPPTVGNWYLASD